MRISWQAQVLKLALRCFVRRRFERYQVSEIRRLAQRGDRLFGKLPASVQVTRETLGGVPVRRARPVGSKANGVLFLIHGGGWCIETPNLHMGFAVRLSAALGMEAVMPAYRLAPEYPFPAASIDCLACWQGLMQSGVEASEVVMAGDSAGGALALGLLGQLRDAGRPMPSCALLLSPATDLTTSGRSAADNEKSDAMFRLSAMFLFRHWYLAGTNPSDSLASPYWNNFGGFPPLMFQVSGSEILLDNSVLAEAKARRQGVTTKMSVWPGMPHDFCMFPFLPEARAGVRELADFARRFALASAKPG